VWISLNAQYKRRSWLHHFITTEQGGTKSVPHIVPFGDLDVQRTIHADEVGGFRFVIREEPLEQWLDHHSQYP
jgi:hypothetical protein